MDPDIELWIISGIEIVSPQSELHLSASSMVIISFRVDLRGWKVKYMERIIEMVGHSSKIRYD